MANLPPVALIQVVHLDFQISPRIFEIIRNDPSVILQGLERRWFKRKKPETKIAWHCHFKLSRKLSFLIFILSVFQPLLDDPLLKNNSWQILLTLSFLSLQASHLCHKGLGWPCIILYYWLAVNYDPATTDLVFIWVNIYPGPGVGRLQIMSRPIYFIKVTIYPAALPANIIQFRANYFWTSQGQHWPLINKVGLTLQLLDIMNSWQPRSLTTHLTWHAVPLQYFISRCILQPHPSTAWYLHSLDEFQVRWDGVWIERVCLPNG